MSIRSQASRPHRWEAGAALKVASTVVTIFADAVISLAEFVNISVSLVTINGGLLAAVVPFIKTSLGVAINLGITSCFHFLDIDFIKTANNHLRLSHRLYWCEYLIIIKTATTENKQIIISIFVDLRICIAKSKAVIANFSELWYMHLYLCLHIRSNSAVSILVGTLIQTTISVVTFDSGIIGLLVPIIKASPGVYVQLDITSHFDFLGLEFTQLGITVGVVVGGGGTVTGSLTTIIADLTTPITLLIEQLSNNQGHHHRLHSATVGCTIEEATAAIGGFLTLIFGALDAVLKVVRVASVKTVFSFSTVAVLFQACTSVVGGLETALGSLVFGTLK
ncbi:hypothetical protein V5O48_016755 [Marasmius crinis-equi]|uniref:Uncharacterized protein n=1 Tax=Marasmius crinis-equi TaxID=585013 RepID=A0ABR3EQU5_9AGAR